MESKAIPIGVFKLDGNHIEKMPCDFIEASLRVGFQDFLDLFLSLSALRCTWSTLSLTGTKGVPSCTC
jgi:hypothetical protein